MFESLAPFHTTLSSRLASRFLRWKAHTCAFEHDNLCVFHILVVLCYVIIHISTNASTISITSGTIQPRFATECHIPFYSYVALLSAALLEQHPCRIARAAVYLIRLSSQDSVDADVDRALIPPSIFAPGGKHGGYGTWQLMTSEEGFQAAQNVLWWLPSDESAAT